MTRKHFTAMAKMFATELSSHEVGSKAYQAVDNVIREFAHIANESNSNFDYARFYTACGMAN